MSSSLNADTLALVNVVRAAYGYDELNDLPASDRGNPSDCLYYRALRDIGVESVGGDGTMQFASQRIAAHVASLWGAVANGASVSAPNQFKKVIARFDGGNLPAHTVVKGHPRYDDE